MGNLPEARSAWVVARDVAGDVSVSVKVPAPCSGSPC